MSLCVGKGVGVPVPCIQCEDQSLLAHTHNIASFPGCFHSSYIDDKAHNRRAVEREGMGGGGGGGGGRQMENGKFQGPVDKWRMANSS